MLEKYHAALEPYHGKQNKEIHFLYTVSSICSYWPGRESPIGDKKDIQENPVLYNFAT